MPANGRWDLIRRLKVKVHQVKVHIFGVPECLQQSENVDTDRLVLLLLTFKACWLRDAPPV